MSGEGRDAQEGRIEELEAINAEMLRVLEKLRNRQTTAWKMMGSASRRECEAVIARAKREA